jgi:hypothetical protein
MYFQFINTQFNYFRPGRVWLMTSRLGDEKILNSFLQCKIHLERKGHITESVTQTHLRGTQSWASGWPRVLPRFALSGGCLSRLQHKATVIHCKKAFRYSRPQPGCHLPNSPGRELWRHYTLFLPRESLVSEILAGDGNSEKLFYCVGLFGRWRDIC